MNEEDAKPTRYIEMVHHLRNEPTPELTKLLENLYQSEQIHDFTGFAFYPDAEFRYVFTVTLPENLSRKVAKQIAEANNEI